MKTLDRLKQSKPSAIRQTFSRYTIINKLGQGGTGEVYLAQDSVLDRKVTIKFLRPESIGDEIARKRLIRGAQAAAKLIHPNIRTVYEVGEAGRDVFIVMEYVDGETLGLEIRRNALDLHKSVDFAVQVAEALSEAHQHGIIHRDIKPDNIMITSRGETKLLDFGIAKAVVRERAGTESQTQTRVTKPGAFVGTLVYASPEQLRRQPVDARSDIFSFGLVLYEMLTGRRPFAAASEADEVSALLTHEAPPLQRHNKRLPSKLKHIVARCLEKEPDRRYQSARELAIDLKKLKHDGHSERSRRRMKGCIRAPARRRKSINTIAVLPMTNASQDPGAEYLSDGITESLINSLSQIPKLRVMARCTVFRYKSRLDDPRQLGSSLGVEAVLVGRVIQRGDRIITSVELVDVTDGATLWGRRFNRRLADIFIIQEEISSEIIASLRLRLTGEERKRLTRRYTDDTKAYQHYLRGRFFWNRRTEEGLQKGIEHFKLAIEADPGYALAYAGLADCYNLLCWWNIIAPQEGLPKAKAAAFKAIELDTTLAEAHASAGAVSETDWDWTTAEREYKRALELNPNCALAHQWYAELLARVGQFDQALQEIKLAEQLDPLCNIINTELGWILFLVGEYESAIEQYRAAVELDPEFAAAHWRLGEAYLQQKMFDLAILEIKRAIVLSGTSLQMLARLAYAYAVSGDRSKAVELLNELNESARRRYVSPYEMAVVHAGLGEEEKALALLERGYRERTTGLTYLKVEPAFSSMRADPRLTKLMRGVGLSMQ